MEEKQQSETTKQDNKTFKEIFFSSKGRLSGREYALYTASLSLWYLVVCFILWLIIWIIYWVIWRSIDNLNSMSVIVAIIIWIPCVIMEIMVCIKRVHDFWKKGSYVRCTLIPLYNIYMWLELLFRKWNEWKNEYWEKPQQFSSWRKALTIILYIIYTLIEVRSNYKRLK